MTTARLATALTLLNLALLALLLSRGPWPLAVAAAAPPPEPGSILRGRALELLDDRGRIRSRLNVEADGEVVLRLIDGNGTIRVKLGAGEDGSGLLLLDEATQPGVHLVARRAGTPAQPATTSLTLRGPAGRERVIRP